MPEATAVKDVPRLLILPNHGPDTNPQEGLQPHILTLPHPRTRRPTRYFYQDAQLYEFTQISDRPPRNTRSWLVTTHESKHASEERTEADEGNVNLEETPVNRKRKLGDDSESSSVKLTAHSTTTVEKSADQSAKAIHRHQSSQAQVLSRASLLVATPLDPLFIILPLLSSSPSALSSSGSGPRHSKENSCRQELFLSFDDIVDPFLDGVDDEDENDDKKRSDEAQNPQDGCSGGELSYLMRLDQDLNPGRMGRLRKTMETRIAAVCDTISLGCGGSEEEEEEQRMYRLNERKLLRELLGKAEHMLASQKGKLPPSMEETFVRRKLAKPSARCERKEEEEERGDEADSKSIDQKGTEEGDSQTSLSSLSSSSSTAALSVSSSGTAITTPDQSSSSQDDEVKVSSSVPDSTTGLPSNPTMEGTRDATDEKIAHLLRLHTCLNYIMTSYIPASLSTNLLSLLSFDRKTQAQPKDHSNLEDKEMIPIIDFSPLHTHLAHLSTLRAQAQAEYRFSQYTHGNKKRGAFSDDDEEDNATTAKKRKKMEEEEQKKKLASQSRAMKDLKKVNTSGMKKIDGFFAKKPVVKPSTTMKAVTGSEPAGLRRSPRKSGSVAGMIPR